MFIHTVCSYFMSVLLFGLTIVYTVLIICSHMFNSLSFVLSKECVPAYSNDNGDIELSTLSVHASHRIKNTDWLWIRLLIYNSKVYTNSANCNTKLKCTVFYIVDMFLLFIYWIFFIPMVLEVSVKWQHCSGFARCFTFHQTIDECLPLHLLLNQVSREIDFPF